MRNMTAGEVLTTGMCPFNCSYCYIPKTEHMKQMHEEIVEDLKSGRFMDRLEEVYGENLTHLGFWGTEPTLTLGILGEKIPEIMQRFPKIKDIGFSSAMMTDPQISCDFIKSISKYPIEMKYQVSLDGPRWITDKNRQEGASVFIPDNLVTLVELLNDVEMVGSVRFRFKATISIDNMRDMLGDHQRIDEYFKYFESIYDYVEATNKNPKVSIARGSEIPTLVVPGKYTVKDGKDFAAWLKLMHSKGRITTYTPRLERIFTWDEELYKRHQFSCSGGDSNFGIGDKLHLCHRTFYLNREKYITSVMEQFDTENWDVSLFRQGKIDHINKNFIAPTKDGFEKTRFLYVMRGYHDFWKTQLGFTITILKELARAGQADKIYLEDEDLALLFAIFQNVAMSCPMENLLNTCSIHVQVLSLIRLFANGAFQEVLKSARERKRKERKK